VKTISDHTDDVWQSGDYVGPDRRPMVRASIMRMHIGLADYRYPRTRSRTWDHKGHYAHAMFGQDHVPRELFNIKSVSWSRSIDQDVAELSMVLYNSQMKPLDEEPENEEDFDHPGWYTPNRGDPDSAFFGSRWGYEQNKWFGWIAPDRMLRTYEGYGCDLDSPPETDEFMYPTGVWLIDSVDLSTDGLITIKARDMGRLLLDQIVMPPVVPRGAYPLWWEKRSLVSNDKDVDLTDIHWPTSATSSNALYWGVAGLHADQEVQNSGGMVRSHVPADAFDDDTSTRWMSNGQRIHDYAWVQGNLGGIDVSAVGINMKGGPYRVFVSLFDGSDWVGPGKIPYHYDPENDAVDVNARIKYVDEFATNEEGESRKFKLHKTYTGITKVRFTFTRLWKTNLGTRFPARAAVQDAWVSETALEIDDTGTHYEGNYDDYTDIVKWFCAWAGFWWPQSGSGLAWTKYVGSDTRHVLAPASEDPALQKGRVWGDFMQTGTTGVLRLPVETFDKAPLMDGVNAIREIIGFDFWIDETGAVVWRLPNIYKKGSYLMPAPGGTRDTRTEDVVVLDERETITDLTVTLASTNVRERIFVANIGGNFGYTVQGYNPYPSGMRRVAGWTDQGFESQKECRRMAEMIAIRQAVTYRQGTITIAANPAIQIDDQVRIYERQTGEGYLHRVTGISAEFDNEEGTFTYTLQTHWLGDEPFTKWAFTDTDLSDVTHAYLVELGAIEDDG
jgi:hypothetical protein